MFNFNIEQLTFMKSSMRGSLSESSLSAISFLQEKDFDNSRPLWKLFHKSTRQ